MASKAAPYLNVKISTMSMNGGYGNELGQLDEQLNGTDDYSDENVLTFIPKRQRQAVSVRADETDNWGNDQVDEREEHILVLKDPSVKNSLLQKIDTFRRNRELCDVVLFVREREIVAHKVVLAAISSSFFDMFFGGPAEPNSSPPPNGKIPPPRKLDELPDRLLRHCNGFSGSTAPLAFYEFAQGDYDCFEALVNYAYTSSLEISSKKIAELYKTSYALQISSCVAACARYLAMNLSVGNCIGIRRQANFHNDVLLVDRVDKFILENFPKIVDGSVEFTQLPVVKARIIVSLEDAQNTSFGSTFAEKALLYFQTLPVNSDRSDAMIDQLTDKMYLLYVDSTKLTDCAEMDDATSVGSCDIVQDYKRGGHHARATSVGSPVGAQSIQHHVTGATSVKINASRTNGKYASTESLNSIASSASDTEEEIQTKLIAVQQTSGEFWVALVVLHHRLVTLSIQLTENDEIVKPIKNGFHADTKAVGDVETKEDRTAMLARLVSVAGVERIPLPPMNRARCSVGAVFMKGKIIVCGGYDRGECLKSVEEYDVVKGEWRKLSSMGSERGRFDAAVLNGKLYAVAGSNGNNDLKSVECYDPQENKWSSVKSVSRARSHNGCVTYEQSIYCIGGSSEQNVLREVERYNAAENTWSPVAPMAVGRFQAGCIEWRGMLCVVGGSDRWNCLDSVESYDCRTDTWKPLPKLKIARRGCAVAVVRDSLYVIGGHDGTQSLNTVDILDSPTGSWRSGPALNSCRANTHAVVTAGNAIYVIGGFNGNQFLPNIEILENESLGWRDWRQKEVNGQDLAEEDETDF